MATPTLEAEPQIAPDPDGAVSPATVPDPADVPEPDKTSPAKRPWGVFLSAKPTDAEIKARLAAEIRDILQEHGVWDKYCCLALLEPDDSINSFDLDEVYAGLRKDNPNRDKDVLLILLSHGGSIEPAYQIAKLCKTFAKERFVAVVPRQAKSAATLIAIGADEIHMGLLGQLGPIDPQLGGLPALSVAQALERIAGLSQQFPGSADMFAKYLQQALTVEQIGYCDRIAQSAEQYAHRLLSAKGLGDDVERIAKELVHAYKDHSFVIDITEAREHLGDGWVKDGTPEIAAAEAIYTLFTLVNLILPMFTKKRPLVIGLATDPSDIFLWPKRQAP